MRGLARVVLALWAAVGPASASEPALRPVAVEALRAGVDPATPQRLEAGALTLWVDGTSSLVLPFRAQVVELDVQTSGVVMLTFAARTAGVEYQPFGPPWRHLVLRDGVRTVRLDYRTAVSWTTSSELAIGLTGAGTVTVRGVRVLPIDPDAARQVEAFDRANLWAPESLGHTTINLLTPSLWRASSGRSLADVVALLAAVAFALALAGTRLRGGRARPALALAVAALVASGLWGAHLLVRFVPAFDLRPTPDPETRIRENYWVIPDVGTVAALARETLGPKERVGIVARDRDWFAPQTICFNLAPRPCVVMRPNEPVHHGIAGVGQLRDDEIDAIVFYRGEWTPAGFERVAGVGPTRFVARRR